MKLITYLQHGQPRLGALLRDRVVDLNRAYRAALQHTGDAEELAVADARVPPDLLGLLQGGERSLAAAQRALAFVQERSAAGATDLQLDGLCCALNAVRWRAPILRPGKVVCVGLNYRSHVAQLGETLSEYPILFHKAATSLIGHEQAIVLPRISNQVDYEGELAVIIGKRGKYIPEREALAYVAGYACANDVSAHDIEFRTSQWTSGKMLDTFCPLGPVMVTREEIPDPNHLRLKTIHNGEVVQDACTSDMHFSVPALIRYISSLTTLEPGDLLLTGTPAGIGSLREPQVFLQPGDHISIEIEGIGLLTNPVIAEEKNDDATLDGEAVGALSGLRI
ncbi:MAG TPA: fumarylacetoacetate hydrolase family protein [Chthonomonadaceae bacterium]|nr:fumarylacetoacetate hydrolase family protein [Chthonomonadaceae bacterium]